jgi:hypothetical protein
MQFTMDWEKFTRGKVEMTIYGHVRGSRRIQSQRKEDVKEPGKRNMIQEELT